MAGNVEIASLLDRAKLTLRKAGISSPDFDAEVLVSSALGVTRAELYINPKRLIPAQSVERIEAMIMKRASRVPLQRILGKCEFMSLEFKISDDVFIPRPETETLVETVLDEAKRMSSPLWALEIGTGCGVIAISLCYYLDTINVLATDISIKAIDLARENAKLNGVSERIDFVLGDTIDFIKHLGDEDGFDIIVSNPPYLRSSEIESLEPEVRIYDPRIAIDGGDDGLRFYRRAGERLCSLLKPGGLVAFEIDARMADDVKDLLQTAGLRDIMIVRDLSGLERVIKGRRING